jgi:hypothetical protein
MVPRLNIRSPIDPESSNGSTGGRRRAESSSTEPADGTSATGPTSARACRVARRLAHPEPAEPIPDDAVPENPEDGVPEDRVPEDPDDARPAENTPADTSTTAPTPRRCRPTARSGFPAETVPLPMFP